MTETTDFTNTFLNSPLSIQQNILEDYEKRIDGEGIVVDPNNTFMFLLESFSRLSSEMTNTIDEKLRQVYPRRAISTDDLYNHLSDYDYVGFFSSPATLPMRFMLHKDFILSNAVPVPGTNYNKVVIPKDTVFDVGGYKFSLYYPIEIRVNPIVNSISIVYDTTETNPLSSLNTNTITSEELVTNGITLIAFEFLTYQFDKLVTDEPVNTNMGFIKKYQFEDKFYAVRVWDAVSGNELYITMSDEVYDPLRGTVILKVYPESNEIVLDIPQIYFTNNIIGNQLRVELYTTLGEVDINLSTLRLDDVKANFSLDSVNTNKIYTSVLRNIPTIIIAPTIQRVQGGSNGYTFDQIKDAVVYHTGSQAAPITNMDLDNYFSTNGFRAYKKIDNLTDRRYYAYKKLVVDDEIAVANGTLSIKPDNLINNDFVTQPTNSLLVILPGMVYRFNPAGNRFLPLANTEVVNLASMSNQELAEELNLNQHLINPYHIVLRTEDRYPTAKLYDMFNIHTNNISFLKENVNLSAQLTIVSAQITHLTNGSGGYAIRLGITKTKEFDTIPINDRQVYLSINTVTNSKVGVVGTYVEEYETLSVYDFILETSYNINDDTIEIDNLTNTSGGTLSNPIHMKDKFYITTMVKKAHFPSTPQDNSILPYFPEDDNTWLMVSLQSVDYQLGISLADVLDTNLLVNWSPEEYATYQMDELLYYEHDVYELDGNGNIAYTINGSGDVETNKLHDMGDPVLDGSGNPIIAHHVGDVILDISGNPTVISPRITEYIIELAGFDYRNAVVDSRFYTNLAEKLNTYYPTIRNMDENILENTKVYFKPITSLGTALYKLNNQTTIAASLSLSFEFKVFVTQSVFSDTNLIATIEAKIADVIDIALSDKIISMMSITTMIKAELDEYIQSIDAISINGDTSIQTLTNIDIDKSPRLGKKLVVDDSGELLFDRQITIEYQALDV